jgi:iron complex transport system permease protein
MTTPLRAALVLAALTAALLLWGLTAGSDGWSLAAWHDPALRPLLWEIRAPRSAGAWLVGALLGLAGAIAQGLFRNPLADPYLLGSSAGAALGVVLVLAATGGSVAATTMLVPLAHVGLVGAAFTGALLGVALTLLLAGGGASGTPLLLAGVVVGIVLAAVAEAATLLAPDTLRSRQVFMLGSTGNLDWPAVAALAAVLLLTLPAAWRCSRALDALALGDDTARSLGLPLAALQRALVALLALATGAAVAQAGLVAFVGLVAPHLVRHSRPLAHGALLWQAAATGGVLLLAADVLARSVLAPQELPVGVLTAVLGGGYLLVRLRAPASMG